MPALIRKSTLGEKLNAHFLQIESQVIPEMVLGHLAGNCFRISGLPISLGKIAVATGRQLSVAPEFDRNVSLAKLGGLKSGNGFRPGARKPFRE